MFTSFSVGLTLTALIAMVALRHRPDRVLIAAVVMYVVSQILTEAFYTGGSDPIFIINPAHYTHYTLFRGVPLDDVVYSLGITLWTLLLWRHRRTS